MSATMGNRTGPIPPSSTDVFRQAGRGHRIRQFAHEANTSLIARLQAAGNAKAQHPGQHGIIAIFRHGIQRQMISEQADITVQQ